MGSITFKAAWTMCMADRPRHHKEASSLQDTSAKIEVTAGHPSNALTTVQYGANYSP